MAASFGSYERVISNSVDRFATAEYSDARVGAELGGPRDERHVPSYSAVCVRHSAGCERTLEVNRSREMPVAVRLCVEIVEVEGIELC
jgi:hypothetical protein